MLEDILEFILILIFEPLEPKLDGLSQKIKRVPRKWVRILLWTLMVIIPVALILGIYALCSYLFRGYWF